MLEANLLPRRPYLFRAFYDWIIDNELTPYLLVDATHAEVSVPANYVQDGKIVLNIAPQSVAQYQVNQDRIEFHARFGGVSEHIIVPMAAIEALYARENGAGIGFEPEPYYDTAKPTTESKSASATFRVVK